MIFVSDEVYMVLIKAANGVWVWMTISMGSVIGDSFWSPSSGLIYTLRQLFGG